MLGGAVGLRDLEEIGALPLPGHAVVADAPHGWFLPTATNRGKSGASHLGRGGRGNQVRRKSTYEDPERYVMATEVRTLLGNTFDDMGRSSLSGYANLRSFQRMSPDLSVLTSCDPASSSSAGTGPGERES